MVDSGGSISGGNSGSGGSHSGSGCVGGDNTLAAPAADQSAAAAAVMTVVQDCGACFVCVCGLTAVGA